MSTATKHMLRSHRSYGKNADFSAFERKAKLKKALKAQAGFFEKLFHRTTNK